MFMVYCSILYTSSVPLYVYLFVIITCFFICNLRTYSSNHMINQNFSIYVGDLQALKNSFKSSEWLPHAHLYDRHVLS